MDAQKEEVVLMADGFDVVISWFGSVPQKIRDKFQRPTKFIDMPIPDGQHYGAQIDAFGTNPLRSLLSQFGIDSSNVYRVAATGFSQGCQGVIALLGTKDAGYLDHTILVDGIHCGWDNGSPNAARDNIASKCIGRCIARADLCSRGPVAIGNAPPSRHFCTITNSSIVHPTMPSTTETSLRILNTLFGSGWPMQQLPDGLLGAIYDPPILIQNTEYGYSPEKFAASQHGLTVLGYNNVSREGRADHIYQATVIFPVILEKILADRWNAVDPAVPNCTGVSGPSCNPEAPAKLPDGYSDDPGDASLNWSKYTAPPKPGSSSGVGLVLSLAAGGGLGWFAFKEFKRRGWF